MAVSDSYTARTVACQGVSVNTVKAWLSVLEASHQVIILMPYFANVDLVHLGDAELPLGPGVLALPLRML